MSTPFTGDLTGSWLFVRTEGAEHTDGQIYHFTADMICLRELEFPGGKWVKARYGYRCADGTLTLIFRHDLSEKDYPLTHEEDGTVKVHGPSGVHWYMERLAAPLPYSRSFVNAEGVLEKVAAPE